MKLEMAKEIIDCLPKGKTPFRYFKGKYALVLLSWFVGQGKAIEQLKRSRFKSLLKAKEVKELSALLGAGLLTQEKLQYAWREPSQLFLLGLDTWSGEPGVDGQVSRSGCNLVLQLNFSNQHDRIFHDLVKPSCGAFFNSTCHPVQDPDRGDDQRETLAWARIDVDFSTGEALIEEIQSDWVRDARMAWIDLKETNYLWEGLQGGEYMFDLYYTDVLAPYSAMWDEAMMTAALTFIRDELGIKNIFYHSVESGAVVKGMYDCSLPTHLYSKLPKRFCFEKTSEGPKFLVYDRRFRRLVNKTRLTWYQLTF